MAKADLNINVKVSGSEKAEKQLEGVGKSARKAGEGAAKGGKEFKSLGKGIGDVSENLDKRLEQSVGRSFRGFDRLTGIVGQATGAMALLTGAAALLKVGYDNLIVPQLESTKRLKEQAKRLAAVKVETDKLTGAYGELTKAIGLNIDEIERLDAVRFESESAALADAKKRFIRSSANLKLLEDEAKTTNATILGAEAILKSRRSRDIDENLEASTRKTIAERRLVQINTRILIARAQEKQDRESLRSARVELQTTLSDIQVRSRPAGPPTPTAAADEPAARARTERPEPFEDFGPSSEAFFEAQRAREQFAAESRARLIEQERIDQSTRIALIQDADDRQRAIIEARQRDEFSRAALAGADLFQLKRAQSAETEAFEEQVSARRRARQQEEIQRTISTVNQISGALAQGAKAFGLGVGVEMFAAGLQDAGTAASEGSKAAARFAVFDVIGGAAHTLAAGLAGAAAIKNFAGAAQLGKGGGGGGGTPVAAIPAPPPRRSDIGEGGRGEAVTNINVTFTGRSFVTQREIAKTWPACSAHAVAVEGWSPNAVTERRPALRDAHRG